MVGSTGRYHSQSYTVLCLHLIPLLPLTTAFFFSLWLFANKRIAAVKLGVFACKSNNFIEAKYHETVLELGHGSLVRDTWLCPDLLQHNMMVRAELVIDRLDFPVQLFAASIRLIKAEWKPLNL